MLNTFSFRFILQIFFSLLIIMLNIRTTFLFYFYIFHFSSFHRIMIDPNILLQLIAAFSVHSVHFNDLVDKEFLSKMISLYSVFILVFLI